MYVQIIRMYVCMYVFMDMHKGGIESVKMVDGEPVGGVYLYVCMCSWFNYLSHMCMYKAFLYACICMQIYIYIYI
jgi:hypothetical protein